MIAECASCLTRFLMISSFLLGPLVILQLRIYALYHLNKKVLAFMITMFLLASTISATVMGIVLHEGSCMSPFSVVPCRY
jgi:predicted MFS family arabinose efflux permease